MDTIAIAKNLLEGKTCDSCWRFNKCIFDDIGYCRIVYSNKKIPIDKDGYVDNSKHEHISLPKGRTCTYWEEMRGSK